MVFTIANAPNCIVRMMFRYECTAADACQDYKTRLVSGYEKIKRPISMSIRQVHDANKCLGNYVISCFVLPFVSLDLVRCKSFNRPINVVLVNNDSGALQVWHVMCMRKNSESVSLRDIKSVSFAQDENDMLKQYDKMLFCVFGNIPSSFVQNLSKINTDVKDIDALLVTEPRLSVNSSPAIICYKQQRTGSV